jgi:hypothetical protein
VNIEQSDSTDNISLSELPTHDTDSLKNHEQHACTPGSLSGSYHSTNIHAMGHSTMVGTNIFLFPQRPVVGNMIACNISKKETFKITMDQ